MYGGTLAAVEHSELDARFIGAPRHFAAEGVKLPDEMAFTGPSDRRVTRHISNRVEVYREADGFHTETRGRKRGFDPRVSRADYGNIKLPRLEIHDYPHA